MNPLPDRIVSALKLQPMTVRQLGLCLGVRDQAIRNRLPTERVRRVGSVKTAGKAWPVYALITGGAT